MKLSTAQHQLITELFAQYDIPIDQLKESQISALHTDEADQLISHLRGTDLPTEEQLIAFCKTMMNPGFLHLQYFVALLRILDPQAGRKKNTSLYQRCIGAYNAFLLQHIGVGAKMDAVEGKAMKLIIKYLHSVSNDKTDDGVLASWQYILERWYMQSEFIGKQKKLTQINKNLIEILDNLRL